MKVTRVSILALWALFALTALLTFGSGNKIYSIRELYA